MRRRLHDREQRPEEWGRPASWRTSSSVTVPRRGPAPPLRSASRSPESAPTGSVASKAFARRGPARRPSPLGHGDELVARHLGDDRLAVVQPQHHPGEPPERRDPVDPGLDRAGVRIGLGEPDVVRTNERARRGALLQMLGPGTRWSPTSTCPAATRPSRTFGLPMNPATNAVSGPW